jgi:hypothetical protein
MLTLPTLLKFLLTGAFFAGLASAFFVAWDRGLRPCVLDAKRRGRLL